MSYSSAWRTRSESVSIFHFIVRFILFWGYCIQYGKPVLTEVWTQGLTVSRPASNHWAIPLSQVHQISGSSLTLCTVQSLTLYILFSTGDLCIMQTLLWTPLRRVNWKQHSHTQSHHNSMHYGKLSLSWWLCGGGEWHLESSFLLAIVQLSNWWVPLLFPTTFTPPSPEENRVPIPCWVTRESSFEKSCRWAVLNRGPFSHSASLMLLTYIVSERQ